MYYIIDQHGQIQQRMFEQFFYNNQSEPKTKQIYLMQNGNPDLTFRHKLLKPINKVQLLDLVEKKWNKEKYKNIRVFSCDAIEYFDEDLLYLKDGDRLFISKGEEFDSNRNFGQYKIIKILGEGGFGSVSLAINRVTQERVAIKVLKANKSSNSNSVDMIFKEAENLKSLSHQNIVKVLNCYALKNMKFVVIMQYLQGGELKQMLTKRQKFTEEQARYYFKQIINAISYCHRQGIVHRDLKLQNIMLDKDKKQIKIADFGISGMADRFNPELDWGTLKYMPPEILNKKQKTNSFSGDIWACGIILFYMVEGYLPFTGNSSGKITQKIVENPVQFSQNCSLSDNCRTLIEGMLRKNPKTRYKMLDIEENSWILRGPQSFFHRDSSKNVFEQQIKKNNLLTKEKKKCLNRKQIHIPCRLQKQKIKISQQLNIYRLKNKNYFRSESKQSKQLPEIQKNFKQNRLSSSKNINSNQNFNTSNSSNLLQLSSTKIFQNSPTLHTKKVFMKQYSHK